MTSIKYDVLINDLKLQNHSNGSVVVQIVLLSKKIFNLANHLKKFKKDLHSKKGLIGVVCKRKKLLKYVKNTNEKKYFFILSLLELRK